MSEEKRKRGRPRKKPIDHNALLEAAEKFNREHNPDCEPATKGYVKCIARKLQCHSHKQHVSSGYTGILGFFLWVAFILSFFGVGTSPTPLPFGWYPATTVFLVGALICTSNLGDICDIENNHTYVNDDQSTVKAIAKYQPPTCEKKNECE